MAKTATKYATPSPRSGVSLPLGNHPGNTGGKKGRSGRKSKAFLQRCIEATEDPTLWDAARKKNPVSVLALAAEFSASKPAQELNATHQIILKAVRE